LFSAVGGTAQPSSVGLTLDGKAICAVNAGPNLEQVFPP
jgi:hypothetical protein